MTIEKKNFIKPDDVRAFEITCPYCKTSVLIPLDECRHRTAFKCPECSAPFFAGGAAENKAITLLAKALDDIKAETNRSELYFRLEIDADGRKEQVPE